MADLGECRSCKRTVVWALTPTGAKAPVNPEPVEGGNMLLLRSASLGGQVWAVTLSGDALEFVRGHPDGKLWLSHWADCPDKAEWRERQAAKRAKREVADA